MDNLTHTLAGAAIGEAGLKKLSGLGMAALMIGANLPDIDALAIPFGENLPFRRGWTHGALAMLLLPVALTLVLVGWDRFQVRRGSRPRTRAPVRPRQLLLLSYVAVLSHPVLDWLNSYGIRLLMPFSQRWFYGDSIFIIDPWIWMALGLGILLSRRRADDRNPPGPARFGLAVVGTYIALMVVGSRVAHGRAVVHMIELEERVPARVMAGPVPLNPLRRELIFDLGDHYRRGGVRWRPHVEITLKPDPIPTNLDHPAARAARGHPEVQGFLVWSRFPFFTIEEGAGTARVHVADARFGTNADWFTVTVSLPLSRRGPDPPARPWPFRHRSLRGMYIANFDLRGSAPFVTRTNRRRIMADQKNDERSMTERGVENNLKGTGKDVKGRAKDAAGGLTGDEKMQAEGKWDKVKGKAQDAIGDAQRKLGRQTDEPQR